MISLVPVSNNGQIQLYSAVCSAVCAVLDADRRRVVLQEEHPVLGARALPPGALQKLA